MTAPSSYRTRLRQRGLVRFEVTGGAEDRVLIRVLAKRLAAAGPEARQLRAAVQSALSVEPVTRGGVLAALRASPLVEADLTLSRDQTPPRPVDL